MADTLEQYWQKWDEAFEAKGHTLIRDEDGDVDHWIVSHGFHNGPGCSTCGYSACHHCLKIDDIPACPSPTLLGEGV